MNAAHLSSVILAMVVLNWPFFFFFGVCGYNSTWRPRKIHLTPLLNLKMASAIFMDIYEYGWVLTVWGKKAACEETLKAEAGAQCSCIQKQHLGWEVRLFGSWISLIFQVVLLSVHFLYIYENKQFYVKKCFYFIFCPKTLFLYD